MGDLPNPPGAFETPPLPPPPPQHAGWVIEPPGQASAVNVVELGSGIWKRIALPGALITLLLVGIPILLQAAITGHVSGDPLPMSARFALGRGTYRASGGSPLLDIVQLVTSVWAYVAVLWLALHATVSEPGPDVVQALTVGLKRLGGGVWTGFAAFVIVVGSLIPIAVASLILWRVLSGWVAVPLAVFGSLVVFSMISVCFAAYAMEGVSGFKATGRSWSLTRKFFWKAVGTNALMFVMTSIISFVITLVPNLVFATDGVGALFRAAASIAAACVVTPLIGGIVAMLYLELRARVDGIDAGIVRGAVDWLAR